KIDRMGAVAVLVLILIVGTPAQARANPESDALRARASDQIYNLDRDLAIATYRQAIAADPQDAAAYRGLASGLWLSITFRRGNMTVDDYLGKVTRPSKDSPAPPPDVVAAFRAVRARPLRWGAYVAGFGGGNERGLRLVEEASEYPSDSQTDARFALILMYNRERRYDDALKQLGVLRDRYPRNRLVWLETGSTNLRAGRAADAERVLTEGIARFGNDPRQRMFGEEALWYYKRGAARAALGRDGEAHHDLEHALAMEGRRWAHGRAHLELGKLALKSGNRPAAR